MLARLNESLLADVLQWLDWPDLLAADSAATAKSFRAHWLLAVSRLNVEASLGRLWKQWGKEWNCAFSWVCSREIWLPKEIKFPDRADNAETGRLALAGPKAGRVKLIRFNLHGKEGISIDFLEPLVGLEHLVLECCWKLTDADLFKLQPLVALKHLELESCAMVTNLRSISSLVSLEQLALTNCNKFNDSTLLGLQPLTNLQRLHLQAYSDRKLSIAGVAHIATLTQLRVLNLGCSTITDAALAPISALKSLTELHIIERDPLCTTKVTGTVLEHLKKLPLTAISLCCKATDAGLAALRYFPGLKDFKLWDAEDVTDEGLQHFRHFTCLERLDLCSCPGITDAAFQHMAGFSCLKKLSLDYSEITGVGLAHLARSASTLTELDLSDSPVNDAGLVHIGELTALRLLGLGAQEDNYDQVTDAGLAHLHALKELRSIWLSSLTAVSKAAAEALIDHCPHLERILLPESCFKDEVFKLQLRERRVECR